MGLVRHETGKPSLAERSRWTDEKERRRRRRRKNSRRIEEGRNHREKPTLKKVHRDGLGKSDLIRELYTRDSSRVGSGSVCSFDG